MNLENKISFDVAWKALATLFAIIIALLFPIGYFVRQGYIQGLGFNVELVDIASVDLQIWGFYGFLNIIAAAIKPLLSSAFIIALVAGTVGVAVSYKARTQTLSLLFFPYSSFKKHFDKIVSTLDQGKRSFLTALLEFLLNFGQSAYYALITIFILAFLVLLLSALPNRLTDIGKTIAENQKERWGASICGDLKSSLANHCVKINNKDNNEEEIGIIIYRSGNEIGLMSQTGAKHLSLPQSFAAEPYDPDTAKNKVHW